MKHVYTNSELPHIWVHGWRRIGNGRNAGDTFYFQQNVIYSYGPHFPIARIVDLPNGQTVALSTTQTWGNTTARHISLVDRALNGAIARFDVPDVMADSTAAHLENWRALRSALNTTRNRIRNAKAPATWDIDRATAQARAANQYAETFGLMPELEETEYPLVAYTESERLLLTARVDAAEREKERAHERDQARHAESQAKQARESAKLARTLVRAQFLERITFGMIKAPELSYGNTLRTVSAGSRAKVSADDIRDWKKGKRADLPYSYSGPVLLRLEKDRQTVRTSKGVRIPVSECAALWPDIEKSRASESRITDFAQKSIGPYRVNYLENGDVKAGCHYVTYAECRKLAIVLGWITPTLSEVLRHKIRKIAA